MKSSFTLFGLILVFLCSCSSEGENQQEPFMVIPVEANEDTELSFDDIASEVEAVKLEETNESLIAFTTKVERTDDYIFVFDFSQQKVFQFDQSGNFLQLMGKIGDGPEEVAKPVGFSIDYKRNHIYIVGMNKIVAYDYRGNFVRSINGYYMPNYTYFRNDLLEIFRAETKNLEGGGSLKFPTLYRINPVSGSRIDSLGLTKVSLKNQMMFILTDANYYSEASDKTYFYLPVLFPEPFVRDTLYEAGTSGLKASVKLDFGKDAISETGSKAINIRGIFRSDRYLFARYTFERKNKLLVHDFKEHKSYNLSDGIDGGVYSDEEPVLLNPLPGTPNTYYFSAKRLDEGMAEEPNPTLYFVKLKN